MPAVIGDPTAPVLNKLPGQVSFLSPGEFPMPIPVYPRQVTLRDRLTIATLLPFNSAAEIPLSLLTYLCDQLNKEIEKGDTYSLMDTLTYEVFALYWFANFGAIMLLGDIANVQEVQAMDRNRSDWSKICLGSFNIKPNYPGRSSHICNGMFLVTDAARNKGVGRLMGECYLEWAPQLGYTYSVFNLMYETNVAMCRIWDALGFKRIGKVPGAGNLKSHPGQLIDAIIYGRDLNPEGEDFVSEERFDKIRYYLKHQKYPVGADRAEKSRLRSAATHYKLVGGENGEREKLMLKDKEVVSDPQQQYEIARNVHYQQHGGINKTTATIALRYHWVRIKETVSMIIKNCPECKETAKPPVPLLDSTTQRRSDKSIPKTDKTPDLDPSASSQMDTSEPSSNILNTDIVFSESQGLDDPSSAFDNTNLFHNHASTLQNSMVDSMDTYNGMSSLDTQMIDDITRFTQHDGTAGTQDPYDVHSHNLTTNDFTHVQIPQHTHTHSHNLTHQHQQHQHLHQHQHHQQQQHQLHNTHTLPHAHTLHHHQTLLQTPVAPFPDQPSLQSQLHADLLAAAAGIFGPHSPSPSSSVQNQNQHQTRNQNPDPNQSTSTHPDAGTGDHLSMGIDTDHGIEIGHGLSVDHIDHTTTSADSHEHEHAPSDITIDADRGGGGGGGGGGVGVGIRNEANEVRKEELS